MEKIILKIGDSIQGSKYKIGDKIEDLGTVAGYTIYDGIPESLIVAYDDGMGWTHIYTSIDIVCKDIVSLNGYTYLDLNNERDDDNIE